MAETITRVAVHGRQSLVTECLATSLGLLGFAATAAAWDEPVRPEVTDVDVVVLDADLASDGPWPAHLEATAMPTVLLCHTWTTRHEQLLRQVTAGGALVRSGDVGEVARAVKATARGAKLSAPAVYTKTSQIEDLTDREREVLIALASGARNEAVAKQLAISPHTVRTHVQNILAKLQVDNRLAASALARMHGLVPPTGRMP